MTTTVLPATCPRHRMQVDCTTYVWDLHKEIERGAERATEAVA